MQEHQYTLDIISALTERVIKRLWIVIILLIVLLVASNGAWLWYESQWETVESTTQEVEQITDGGGSNSFVGGDVYGSSEGQDGND